MNRILKLVGYREPKTDVQALVLIIPWVFGWFTGLAMTILIAQEGIERMSKKVKAMKDKWTKRIQVYDETHNIE